MTCLYCAEHEQLRLAARLETLEQLNADLTGMLKYLIDKRLAASTRVSNTALATLQPGVMDYIIKQIGMEAVHEVERVLGSRRALYEELTQLRFAQGKQGPLQP